MLLFTVNLSFNVVIPDDVIVVASIAPPPSALVVPLTIKLPSIYKLLPIPTPPLTCKAPVVALLDWELLSIITLPCFRLILFTASILIFCSASKVKIEAFILTGLLAVVPIDILVAESNVNSPEASISNVEASISIESSVVPILIPPAPCNVRAPTLVEKLEAASEFSKIPVASKLYASATSISNVEAESILIPPAIELIWIALASVPRVFVITIFSLVPPFVVNVRAEALLLVVSIVILLEASISSVEALISIESLVVPILIPSAPCNVRAPTLVEKLEAASEFSKIPVASKLYALATSILIPPAIELIWIALASVPWVFVITIFSLVPPFVVNVRAEALLLVVSIVILLEASISSVEASISIDSLVAPILIPSAPCNVRAPTLVEKLEAASEFSKIPVASKLYASATSISNVEAESILIPPAIELIWIALASVPRVFVITIFSLVPPFVVNVRAEALLLVVSIVILLEASISNVEALISIDSLVVPILIPPAPCNVRVPTLVEKLEAASEFSKIPVASKLYASATSISNVEAESILIPPAIELIWIALASVPRVFVITIFSLVPPFVVNVRAEALLLVVSIVILLEASIFSVEASISIESLVVPILIPPAPCNVRGPTLVEKLEAASEFSKIPVASKLYALATLISIPPAVALISIASLLVPAEFIIVFLSPVDSTIKLSFVATIWLVPTPMLFFASVL